MRYFGIRLWRTAWAELTKIRGKNLWLGIPLAVFSPALVSLPLVAFANQIADSDTGIVWEVSSTAFWVINLTVIIMMILAINAVTMEYRYNTLAVLLRMQPKSEIVQLAKWLVYGGLTALICAVNLPLLTCITKIRYKAIAGNINFSHPDTIRFFWTVPVYGFIACGLAVGLGTLVKNALGAVALLLTWIFVIETGIVQMAFNSPLMTYLPFIQVSYFTGQFFPNFAPWHGNRNLAGLYLFIMFFVIWLIGVVVNKRRDL